MKNTFAIPATVVLAVVLVGCATKRYGRAVDVTSAEASIYTCKDIQLELAKARGFLDQVNRESQFSGADVLAFLGDFGIGNSLERSAAIESGNERITQLDALSAEKCATTTLAPITPPAPSPSALTIAPSPVVVTTPASTTIQASSGRDPIREMQAALASQGFYAGDLTGTLDVDTLTAISAFQKSIGLPPTGYAGPETVKALGL